MLVAAGSATTQSTAAWTAAQLHNAAVDVTVGPPQNGWSIQRLQTLCANLAKVAGNSAQARQACTEDKLLDGGLIWNIS